MSTSEPLPGFKDRVPPHRYCDLILTGGVTSSIAYPAAIFALATAYRFNSIGGSSSGAGAAALAAAAEYRRRHGSSDGFRIMLERAAAVADDLGGKTRLERLFQPEEDNRRLFEALLPGFANPSGKLSSLGAGIVRAYSASPAVVVIGILLAAVGIGALVTAWQGVIGPSTAFLTVLSAASLSLIWAVAAMILLVARDLGRIVQYDYGLCSGHQDKDDGPRPLTDWLHGLIQEIAGRKANDRPLTFADLATAPGSPRETLNDPSPMGADSINLQMITANVTHGRPYVFPQTGGVEGDPPLYFREEEMAKLFPADVVSDMKKDPDTDGSNEYEGNARPADELPRSSSGAMGWFASLVMKKPPPVGANHEKMYRLPTKHLPIIVAARMSVSFPVLFRAVPLWVLDEREQRKPVFRRCLFCDGGICSAFPIHLFDSPIPSWPTFGISLHKTPKSEHSSPPSASKQEKRIFGAVWLPQGHLEGGEEQWDEFEAEPEAFNRLAGFFGALASTTKNWNDATLARLPGVRERVARVGLGPGIGGLNIRMTASEIRELAALGRDAALQLLKRYAFPVARPSNDLSDGWNEHRWVRLNVLRDSLSTSLSGLTWAAVQGGQGKPLRDLIRQAAEEPVLKMDECSRLLAAQAAALEAALSAMVQAERALTMPTAEQPYKPFPRPVMRVRPPL
jgi:predicted acylesterase/phospholipase RssA